MRLAACFNSQSKDGLGSFVTRCLMASAIAVGGRLRLDTWRAPYRDVEAQRILVSPVRHGSLPRGFPRLGRMTEAWLPQPMSRLATIATAKPPTPQKKKPRQGQRG